jgi:hypothetical protein
MTLGRALQVLQLGVICSWLGGGSGASTALVAQGVQLIATTVGDVIPAQLGVMDAAFAVAGPELGMTAATGAAAGLVLHVVQLGWAAIAACLALVMPGRILTEGTRAPTFTPLVERGKS